MDDLVALHAQAVERMDRLFRSLRDEHAKPIDDLSERLVKLVGMHAMFPGHFLYVVNYSRAQLVHADGFHRVLGYPDHTVDLPLLYTTWHPEDAPTMAHLVEVIAHRMMAMDPPMAPFEASLLVDYRMRKADGTYIKVLRNTVVFDVRDGDRAPVSILSLCQDISHIKHNNTIGWQILGPGAERFTIKGIEPLPRLHYQPSPRELDVMRALAHGRSSKAIAQALHISTHTVNTHRRNLLDRTGCRNTAELVRLSITKGWA